MLRVFETFSCLRDRAEPRLLVIRLMSPEKPVDFELESRDCLLEEISLYTPCSSLWSLHLRKIASFISLEVKQYKKETTIPWDAVIEIVIGVTIRTIRSDTPYSSVK